MLPKNLHPKPSPHILIKKQQLICKVQLDEIEYIEVEKNYSTVHTSTQKFVIKKSLSEIKSVITNGNFEQIHRKFLVNFDKVKEISLGDNAVYLYSKTRVTISERYKRQLNKRFDIIK